jgi:integrase
VSEWFQNGRELPRQKAEDVTVATVIAEFWRHAQDYYRKPDGTPSSEATNLRYVLRPLRRLYGNTPAAEFGPKALKVVREERIRLGWVRSNINRQINRLKHVFKWATQEELIPPSVYHGLQAVSGLRAGRSDAPESEPVRPVPEELLQAVLPHVSSVVAAMIQLQLLTGMRPGEVCAMRACDIDRSGKLWIYRPPYHKTLHHGHTREVFLGPHAQRLIEPFIMTNVQAHLFRPAAAVEERRQRDHDRRKTPIGYGNRPGTNRKPRPQRKPGDAYDVDAYRRAVARGCDRAFPPPEALKQSGREEELKAWIAQHRWHPHQLRHTAATKLRKGHGLEAAQVILGHRMLTTTQIYAEKNDEFARRVVAEIG